MHAAGCPIREQFLRGKPPPQRGAQWDGGCPPPSWGRSRRNGDVGSPHSPGDKQQTAETPPATQSRKGGMSPFPQGAAAGQQGSPLPILWQRSAPTGCPLWQRARKERGARPPPALEAPRWARGGAGRASDPHGGGLGAARSLWGAAGQQRTDRRTRDGHSFPPRGNEGGRPRAPDPPHPHGRGRTNSHGRTQRPTVRRGGTVGLPHSVGATPQRSKGALQRLVAAVLGLDELEDEEEDGLHAEHQHHAAHKAGRVEARRLELGAARQRGARGAAPYGTEWGYGDGP